MSKMIAAGALALALIAGPALAQPPAAAPAAPAAAAGKLSAKSPLKELIANPKAKEVLKKHIGQVVDFMEMAGDMLPPEMTVESLAEFPQAGVTPEIIKAINEDLAKI